MLPYAATANESEWHLFWVLGGTVSLAYPVADTAGDDDCTDDGEGNPCPEVSYIVGELLPEARARLA